MQKYEKLEKIGEGTSTFLFSLFFFILLFLSYSLFCHFDRQELMELFSKPKIGKIKKLLLLNELGWWVNIY